MSILKTTNTGLHQKLTIEMLKERGYEHPDYIPDLYTGVPEIDYSILEKKIKDFRCIIYVDRKEFYTEDLILDEDKYLPRRQCARFFPHTLAELFKVEKLWKRKANGEKIMECDMQQFEGMGILFAI